VPFRAAIHGRPSTGVYSMQRTKLQPVARHLPDLHSAATSHAPARPSGLVLNSDNDRVHLPPLARGRQFLQTALAQSSAGLRW
jgi:hypothetical protein